MWAFQWPVMILGLAIEVCTVALSHFLGNLWLVADLNYIGSTQLAQTSWMIPCYLWMRSESKISDIIKKLLTGHIFAQHEFHDLLTGFTQCYWSFKSLLVLNILHKIFVSNTWNLILSFVQSQVYGIILIVGCSVAVWEQVCNGGTFGQFVIVRALSCA